MTTHSDDADHRHIEEADDTGPAPVWVDLRGTPEAEEIMARFGWAVGADGQWAPPSPPPPLTHEQGLEVAEHRRLELGLAADADSLSMVQALLGDDHHPALRYLVHSAMEVTLADDNVQRALADPKVVELASMQLVGGRYYMGDMGGAVIQWYDSMEDAALGALRHVVGPGFGDWDEDEFTPTWLAVMMLGLKGLNGYSGVQRSLTHVIAEAVVLYAALRADWPQSAPIPDPDQTCVDAFGRGWRWARDHSLDTV